MPNSRHALAKGMMTWKSSLQADFVHSFASGIQFSLRTLWHHGAPVRVPRQVLDQFVFVDRSDIRLKATVEYCHRLEACEATQNGRKHVTLDVSLSITDSSALRR